MANTINQASANPTNKLTAATLATAVIPVVGLLLRNLAPQWYDPEVMMALMPVMTFVFGWFVKDAPNIVVVQEAPK
jgi:hypothetical protein